MFSFSSYWKLSTCLRPGSHHRIKHLLSNYEMFISVLNPKTMLVYVKTCIILSFRGPQELFPHRTIMLGAFAPPVGTMKIWADIFNLLWKNCLSINHTILTNIYSFRQQDPRSNKLLGNYVLIKVHYRKIGNILSHQEPSALKQLDPRHSQPH